MAQVADHLTACFESHRSAEAYALSVQHPSDSGAGEHSVLVGRLVGEVAHGQAGTQAPAEEDEAVAVHRREPAKEPFAPR